MSDVFETASAGDDRDALTRVLKRGPGGLESEEPLLGQRRQTGRSLEQSAEVADAQARDFCELNQSTSLV